MVSTPQNLSWKIISADWDGDSIAFELRISKRRTTATVEATVPDNGHQKLIQAVQAHQLDGQPLQAFFDLAKQTGFTPTNTEIHEFDGKLPLAAAAQLLYFINLPPGGDSNDGGFDCGNYDDVGHLPLWLENLLGRGGPLDVILNHPKQHELIPYLDEITSFIDQLHRRLPLKYAGKPTKAIATLSREIDKGVVHGLQNWAVELTKLNIKEKMLAKSHVAPNV